MHTSLMYFTSGTTGEPKMVAHDFTGVTPKVVVKEQEYRNIAKIS